MRLEREHATYHAALRLYLLEEKSPAEVAEALGKTKANVKNYVHRGRKKLIDYLREEVYYREAIAMGLHRDDQMVRRRMRQKLEFLGQDLAEAVEPTEQDLRAWLDAHPDDYRRPGTTTFVHVFFRLDEAVEQRRHIARTMRQEVLDHLLRHH